MRAAHRFGGGLALGLLVLWCLISVIEISAGANSVAGGWIWGLVVFGLAGTACLACAGCLSWGTAQSARVNPLLKKSGTHGLRAEPCGNGRRAAGVGGTEATMMKRRQKEGARDVLS